jgi:hypothetical protein
MCLMVGRTVFKRAGHRITALALCAAVGGALCGWAWDLGRTNRDTRGEFYVNTGADASTYVLDGGTPVGFTVPVRDDNSYAITLTFLEIPGLPKSTWHGAPTVIQPGSTQSFSVAPPRGCPEPVRQASDGKAPAAVAWLELKGANGSLHKIVLSVLGAVQYVQYQCGHYVSPTVVF